MSKKTKKNPKPQKAAGAMLAVAPAAGRKPTPNEALNLVINSLAYCSGYSASAITKDWVLGDSYTDPAGDRHPGAGLSQNGIDTCFNTTVNQFITYFGSSNTISSGTYSATTSVSDVQKDVLRRI